MKATRINWTLLSLLVIVSMLLPGSGPVQGAISQALMDPRAGQVLPDAVSQMAGMPDTPVVARVYYQSRAELEKMSNYLDIWETHPDQVYLVALLTPAQYASLAASGYRLEIDFGKTMLLSQINQPLSGQTSGIPGYPCYRTVEETYTSMMQLATDHPDLASYNVIGQSWDKARPGGPAGYDLKVLVVTNQNSTVAKQKFFLMAEIHAREYVTAETAARFAEFLINNYGINPDVTWMLDYFEIHILVMTNPDGRKKAETGLSWRKNTDTDDNCTYPNAYGVDLNRNASYKWGGAGSSSNSCDDTYHGRAPASEPETLAVQNYVASILPDLRGPLDTDVAPDTYPGLFLTLHSYSGLVLYPWGWTNTSAPNSAGLSTLGKKFGYYNHYVVQQSIGLYPTTGTTDDWAYATLGVPAYTFEMGNDFFQDCSYFESTIYPDNFKAIFYGAKTARMPYRMAYGPEVINVNATPPALKAGGSFALTATADGTRYSNGVTTKFIGEARYSLDKPSWDPAAVMVPMTGTFNTSKTIAISATISTAGWGPGKHLVFIEAKDTDGNWGVPTAIYVEIATFGLSILPAADSREVERGTTASYTLRVTNTGNAIDTYTVQTGSSLGWNVTAPATVGPVPVGGNQDFSVQVAVPAGVTGITPDVTTVTLTSTGDPVTTGSATLTTSALLYNFSLAPATDAKLAEPGQTVTYHLTVTSTGAIADSYTVQAESSKGWEVGVPATIGPVASGTSFDLPVNVTIPLIYTGTTPDITTVTVTSLNNPAKVHQATLTTIAILYGIGLTPDMTASNALAGTTITFHIQVKNEGIFTDTFSLEVSGGAWSSSLPISIGPLAFGAIFTLNVTVNVPAGTPVGTQNAMTLKFTSQANPGTVKSITLTTTVANPQKVFLPLVNQ